MALQVVPKSAYIRALFVANPALLPVFDYLVTWARNAEIIKTDDLSGTGYLSAPEFYAVVLKGLEMLGRLPEVAEVKLHGIEELPELFEQLLGKVKNLPVDQLVGIGQTVVDFFRWCSELRGKKGNGRFVWPGWVGPNEVTIIPAVLTGVLSSKAEKTVLCFAFHRSAALGLDEVILKFWAGKAADR